MKELAVFLTTLMMVLSCSSSERDWKKAEPLILEKTMSMISHPETYHPISHEDEGLLDVRQSDINFYSGDSTVFVTVRVFTHTFTHLNRLKEREESKYEYWLTPELDYVYGMHMRHD